MNVATCNLLLLCTELPNMERHRKRQVTSTKAQISEFCQTCCLIWLSSSRLQFSFVVSSTTVEDKKTVRRRGSNTGIFLTTDRCMSSEVCIFN